MPDVDPDLESSARRAFARLGSAIALPDAPPAPPSAPDGGGPAFADDDTTGSGRRRLVLAAAASAAVVAAGAGVVVAATGDDPDGAGLATAPAAGEPCRPRQAAGDVIDRGRFADGVPWHVSDAAGTGGDEWFEGAFAAIDGEDVGGWANNADSWPRVVNEGVLTWQVAEADGHRLVYGQVPTTTTRVEVSLADGTTVAACPVALPTMDVLHYFATPLPPGVDPAEGRALDAQGRPIAEAASLAPWPGDPRPEDVPAAMLDAEVDPALVPLPLGGEAAAPPAPPVMHDVVTGEVPSGPWALRLGTDGPDDYVVELRLPGELSGPGTEGNLDQLLGPDRNWQVDSVDGRHLVWGLTAPEVATVRVTLAGGATVDVPTVPPGTDAVPARAFAGTLPEGGHLTAIEGLTADGEVVERAVDVAEGTATLATFPPNEGVGLLVERTG